MARSRGIRSPLVHPSPEALDLLDILHALSDRTRMAIVRTLVADGETLCGRFAVDVSSSTLSHHFRVLREAGVIEQRDEGTRRWTRLRREDLDHRFPGLLETVLNSYAAPPRRRRKAATPA